MFGTASTRRDRLPCSSATAPRMPPVAPSSGARWRSGRCSPAPIAGSIEELQQPRWSGLLCLFLGKNVPVFRARQAFFEIPRRRGRVRRIASRDDERRDLRAQQVLGLRTRRSIAVEERAAHVGDELFVLSEAQGPPLGSALNAFASCITSDTTPARPRCSTYARWSAKRLWVLIRYFAPPTGQ